MQILVLGMHRSGTSTVARLLNMMGAYFGPEGSMTPPNAENPRGFWERRDCRAINDALLRSQGAEWNRISAFNVSAVPESTRQEQRKLAERLVLDLDSHRPWVLKEPRLCFTLPFWRPLFDIPVALHVLRDPVQVALSLRKRNGIPAPVGAALWEAYVIAQFQNSQGIPSVCVMHQDVLQDPVGIVTRMHKDLVERGVRRLDVPHRAEIEGFVDPTLFRSRDLGDERQRVLSPEQQEVWDLCLAGKHELLQDRELSKCSREALQEYEPLALKLERLEETHRSQAEQSRKLSELEARTSQDAARHRQAMTEIAAGLRDVARAANALGQAVPELRDVKDRMARLEQASTQSNAHVSMLYGQVVDEVKAEFEHLEDDLKRWLLDGFQDLRTKELTPLADELKRWMRSEQASRVERALEVLGVDLRLALDNSSERTVNEVIPLIEPVKDALGALETKFETLRGAEQRLNKLAEEQKLREAQTRQLLKRLSEAAAAYRSSWGYRLAKLAGWPLRLIKGDGDAIEHIQSSCERELAKHAVHPGLQSSVLDVLRSAESPPTHTGRASDVPANRRPRHIPTAAERLHLGDIKVLVLAWDAGHNPVGRAFMLAEALASRFEVVLAAPQFARYGTDVWAPIAGQLSVPLIRLPGASFPTFFHDMQSLARRIEADVIVACKPRLPSMELGFLMKEFTDRPLILDIDDHELAFFGGRPPIPEHDLDQYMSEEGVDLPYGEIWTRHAETLVGACDAVLVSNQALQRRFGGTLIPHARDFETFNPSLYSRDVERARIGFAPLDKVILFLGTVRPHKGVDRVASALAEIADPNVKLCIMGDVPDLAYKARLEEAAGERVKILGSQPFESLPRNVVAADLVVLLQDPASPIAQYQLPAKIVDAIAMQVPVLATPTEPIASLIESGLVQATSSRPLSEDIKEVLGSLDDYRARLASQREALRSNYSYAGIACRMESLILELLASEPAHKLPPEAAKLLERHRRMYPQGATQMPAPGSGLDLVFFWKQNDTCLYGRRIDMLVKYLSLRSEVRSITVFDAPTDVSSMRRWRTKDPSSQRNQVHDRTLAKRWGLMDYPKVRFATFVSSGKGRRNPLRRWPYPASSQELSFYVENLHEQGVDPGSAVFFVYPCNRRLPDIIRGLNPRLVVCDLVDDHRTWSGLKPEALAAMEENYREVLGLSDIALANCEAVRESMSEWHPRIEVIANACEIQEGGGQATVPAELGALSGPILGYVGNLEDKLDIDLLRKVATHRPDAHIVLIGSTHANPAISELGAYPNIHLLGVRPYERVGDYIRRFDVALIPHRDNEKTRAMNPLKLMVYCSHNVPVVTTEIANLGELGEFCRKASSDQGFLQAIDEALAQGRQPEPDPKLKEALHRNSWGERTKRIIELIVAGLRQRDSIHAETGA